MKLIKDYTAYKITKDGKVLTCFKPKTSKMSDSWRELKQVYDKSSGYLLVTLCDGKGRRQNKRVHRLLMETFVPNPNNYPQINHIDGNKLNNNLSNLEWCTASHNSKHAVTIGLCDERRKQQETPVLQLKDNILIAEHTSLHEAGRTTGIAWQNISKVCRGLRKSAGKFQWRYK